MINSSVYDSIGNRAFFDIVEHTLRCQIEREIEPLAEVTSTTNA